MGQLPGDPPDFAPLFADPSIEGMLQLTDHEFEHFVGYVFEQAGYVVEDAAGKYGQGLDLRLYTRTAHAPVLHAGVSVKKFRPPTVPPPHSQVGVGHVVALKGALAGQDGVAGYIVTSSIFTPPGHAKALDHPLVWPVDGEHLIRYITYIRGSLTETAEDKEPDERLRRNPLIPIPAEVFNAADDIAWRPATSTSTKILTVANHKGGVGKTTTALNFGQWLAAQGKQVLLIDMDAQANLTKTLPTSQESATEGHIGHYFTNQRVLSELVRPTNFKGVWLIPSNNLLARSDMGIMAGPGAELRFARDVHAPAMIPPPVMQAQPFDWIILDTGPTMGLFTRSAIAASHHVLLPIEPSVFAELGIDLLRSTINAMQALTNRQIHLLGCLITQWKADALNKSLFNKLVHELEPTGIEIISTKIPLDKAHIEKAHIEAAQGRKRGLFNGASPVAVAYSDAFGEVLEEVKKYVH
jgi:chromosome partitioning protein